MMLRTASSRRFWAGSAGALVLTLAIVTPAQAQDPLDFSKTFLPGTLGVGSVSTLAFEITNLTGTPVSGLAFTDTLPAGVLLAAPVNAVTSCVDGLIDASAGGSTITFSNGRLAPFATCTVRVDVTSSTPGTHTNVSGNLSSSLGTFGTATADLVVDPLRPGFTKSFDPNPISLGGTSTLTFTIDNSGAAGSATSLSFTDTLPPGLLVANPANASTDCAGAILTAVPGTNVISMVLGSVAGASVCTVTVDVTANLAGSLGNTTGELESSAGSSGKASAVLEVVLGLLSKIFTDDPVPPGGTVTLEFTLTNFDRVETATNIAFTDDLDAVLSGLTAVGLPLVDPCGPGSLLSGTSVLTFTGGSLVPEASCTFSVTLQVPAGAVSATYTNTTSPVTLDLGGVPVVEPAATDDLIVQPVPLLTKTFTDDPVAAGDSVTLEFTVTNTSPTLDATDILFTDDLTATLPGLAAVGLPASNVCGAGSQISGTTLLVLTGGNLAAGDSCTFSITLGVPAESLAGTYPNTTSPVTATIGDFSLTGNPASDSLVVAAAPTLTKSFTDDPVLPGSTVTLEFTLFYNENAPAGATGITFTDDLAATLPGLTALGLPANDVCGAGSQISGTTLLTFTGGNLGIGESCAFSVTLQVPAAAAVGDHPNSTSNVTAVSLGLPVTGSPGTDVLQIAGLSAAKLFLGDPVVPGATVTLQFTFTNLSLVSSVTGITFTDDLTAALPGLAAVGLPANDICGAGSQISGTSLLIFTGGTLAPGTSCTFPVTLQVPTAAVPGEYVNLTSPVDATVSDTPITIPGAVDTLTVLDALSLTKSFTDDPAVSGGTVTLEFTVANADPTQSAAGITFTDDLDAALPGLAAVGLPANDVCGAGSQISGTSVLTLTGGNLGPSSSCTFSVTLQVPPGVPFGTTVINTTSAVTGTVGGVAVTGAPATDVLQIDFFQLTKAFDGPTAATGTPTLTFTLQNLDPSNGVSNLSFLDDLDAVLPGLVAVGLPAGGVCGAGSQISGTSLLTFSGGSLGPGGSCSFSVTLQVPAGAAPGSYPNTTSELLLAGLPVSAPATDTLVIEPPPTFTKGFAPDFIGVGAVSTLSFVIDNTASAVAASALDFTDNLPAGVEVASPANAMTTCTGGTLTADPGTGVIAYTGGTVAAGTSCLVQVAVTGTAPGAHVNLSGELTSSSGASGTATATLTVNPQPGFSKSFAPDPIAVGGVSTLTFAIDNSGSTVDATSLNFTDNLPAGVVVAIPANDSTTCTGGTLTAISTTGLIAYSDGSVAAGAVCTVQADVTSTTPGTHVNTTGNLTSSLGSSGPATDDLTVVEGLVALSKTFVANPVLRGGTVALEFTVTNVSAVFPLTGIAFTDDLDAVVPGLAAVGLPASDVCGAGSVISGTSVVSLTGGSLAPGASCTFSVSLLVPADAPLGIFPNTSSPVTALAAGAPVQGPPAAADLEVVFLEIVKAFGAGTVDAGTTVSLSFTITNPDPVNPATGITFTDDLDAALLGLVALDVPQSDVCGAGSLLDGVSLLTLTGGSLAPGASCTFGVTLQVPSSSPSGTVTNVTSVLDALVGGAPATGDPAGAAQAVVTVVAAIPTLGALGLAALAALLALLAVWQLRRRRV
jgi:uncharacterized repeat protein (TIGR01451 family)